MRGYFAIGVYHPKCEANIGTLWRAASLYGAAFVFTVGRRYRRQCSDTVNTPLHTPLLHFADASALHDHLPHGAILIGVELHERARMLSGYRHAINAVYLLGAEDHGLPPAVIERCHSVVQIECPTPRSMNVSAAGSIVMWHRHCNGTHALRSVA